MPFDRQQKAHAKYWNGMRSGAEMSSELTWKTEMSMCGGGGVKAEDATRRGDCVVGGDLHVLDVLWAP